MDVEYRYDWKLIACVDDHWGIGRQGQLLVDIPADKKAFKAHTIGKIVVGGRKTMEGLPGARALPDRTNIVLSTDETYCFEGAQVLQMCIRDSPMRAIIKRDFVVFYSMSIIHWWNMISR